MKLDPLGDSISSVELTDRMGDDLMVVNATHVVGSICLTLNKMKSLGILKVEETFHMEVSQ